MDYEISRMVIKPEKLTCGNIRWILENPGETSEELLYELMDSTLTLIQEQFPELEDKIANRRKRMSKLAVKPCKSRPALL